MDGVALYIDCHAHLEEFGERRLAELRAGDVKVIANSVDMQSYEFALAEREKSGAVHRVFFGLHPDRADLGAAGGMLEHAKSGEWDARIDGIGEVGLDSKYGKMGAQKAVFEKFLGFAQDKGLPVAVHSRNSVQDVLDMLQGFSLGAVMMHWFSGSDGQLRAAIEMGYFIGITPSHPKGSRWIIEKCRVGSMLLETDSPVLGRKPADVVGLAEEVAEIKGMAAGEFLEQHGGNVKRFCNGNPGK